MPWREGRSLKRKELGGGEEGVTSIIFTVPTRTPGWAYINVPQGGRNLEGHLGFLLTIAKKNLYRKLK